MGTFSFKLLPDPEDGTIYICSVFVANAVSHRKDVVYPDSGPDAIRDSKGQVVQVKRFLTAPENPLQNRIDRAKENGEGDIDLIFGILDGRYYGTTTKTNV